MEPSEKFWGWYAPAMLDHAAIYKHIDGSEVTITCVHHSTTPVDPYEGRIPVECVGEVTDYIRDAPSRIRRNMNGSKYVDQWVSFEKYM
jgi:hypothetical protein